MVEKKFKEINDANFKRDKDNLHTTIELDFYKSILGGELMVSTFNGKTKLIIEPETKNGTKLKLKGKGFPKYKKKGQFGDLFITFDIKIPTNLSVRENQFYKELAKLRQ